MFSRRDARWSRVVLISLFGAWVIGAGFAASAAVFNVTANAVDAHDANTADGICNDGSGNCTLRAAMEQADQLGGANTINVPAGSYLLSAVFGPLKTVNGTNNLSIIGTGAAGTAIIDGQNATTVFRLTGNGGTVNINNLVIQHGMRTITDPGLYGLCVGAGISVDSSMVINVQGSVIQNNTAANGSGGGICINFGLFNLSSSIVRGNSAGFGGGGIRITGGAPPGTLVINDSTISGNITTGLAGAQSSSQAGGIVSQATVQITNSTISGNTATDYASAFLSAGSSPTTLRNVTIAGNIGAGAQMVIGGPGTLTSESTIIANPVGGGTNCEGGAAFYTSNGHNLDSGNTCHFVAGTDLTNVNPNLGPLQDNGGPTPTLALLGGSLAIDRGSNPVLNAFDQRGPGFPRASGAAADIGAFEFQGAGGVPTLDADASSTATKYDALTDGLLILRHLFGLTGSSLTAGATGASAARTDPVAVKAYLDGIRNALDIDASGATDALTDGLLVMRYLFGLRGASLIANAVDPAAQRSAAAAIESYILLLMP